MRKYLDRHVHAYCHRNHDVGSKDEEYVIKEKTSQKNKSRREGVELDVLRSTLTKMNTTSKELKATANAKILDMIQFLVNA